MRPCSTSVLLTLSIGLLSGSAHAQAGNPGDAPPAASGQALSPDALDKLLAPIALYPDALIIQIVQCASSPYQVRQVSAWLKQNPDLKGTAAQDAASKHGFDASFVAIVLFPQVLQMMADQPDWTRDLGQAFTTDRDGVLASVQRLRKEAEAVGNLKSTEQQQVQTVTTGGGQQVIVIEPANPQVVYVPVYNPQVVYTQPAPPPPSSTSSSDDGDVATAALIGFAAGVIIGAAADNDDHHYYYSYGGWGYHGPICYPGGYNDYYDHREDMANDYYDHRENMAKQAGENQANRQQAVSDNRSSRQANGSQARTTNQSQRQANASQWQSTPRTSRGTTTTRGSFASSSPSTLRTSGSSSSAFSGYQRGSTERQSSLRGRSSMSRGGRGGFSRGGGRRRR